MGLGGISLWQLLILLVIVVLLFGTKRLRNLGSDLSSAIKDFRSGLSDEDKPSERIEADSSEESSADSERQKDRSRD